MHEQILFPLLFPRGVGGFWQDEGFDGGNTRKHYIRQLMGRLPKAWEGMGGLLEEWAIYHWCDEEFSKLNTLKGKLKFYEGRRKLPMSYAGSDSHIRSLRAASGHVCRRYPPSIFLTLTTGLYIFFCFFFGWGF